MRDELDQRTHCLQMPITIGYASISSSLKLNELESQIALLGQQGCHRVLHDITYGINASRPSLDEILSLSEIGKASIEKAKLRGSSIGRRRIINESLYKTALEHICSGDSVRSAAIKVGVSKSTLYAEINRRKAKVEN